VSQYAEEGIGFDQTSDDEEEFPDAQYNGKQLESEADKEDDCLDVSGVGTGDHKAEQPRKGWISRHRLDSDRMLFALLTTEEPNIDGL
jgi:hypothetical protein